jgi:Mrp family chromosome partitioning ATPase
MAEVPPLPAGNRGQPVIRSEPAAFLEAYRGLRTAVSRWAEQGDPAGGGRVVIVTSASVDEGKTTTVAQLAAALAESGHSVLAVSADLRRPRLHLYFDRPRDPGLAEMLAGGRRLPPRTDGDLDTAVPGIQLLSSGRPVDNPGPLLDRAGAVFRDARSSWDFVLVDAPALLVTGDAGGLAGHADGVLLVVRNGRTPIAAARRSVELLERLDVPLIGAVLVG